MPRLLTSRTFQARALRFAAGGEAAVFPAASTRTYRYLHARTRTWLGGIRKDNVNLGEDTQKRSNCHSGPSFYGT